mmetsp:Transcript_13039/g.37557  ORF Transcript_13039/g.37557 Transcript_13039/m.37557 type:complete len:103 (+) Transcript_13039:774-1082(+)
MSDTKAHDEPKVYPTFFLNSLGWTGDWFNSVGFIRGSSCCRLDRQLCLAPGFHRRGLPRVGEVEPRRHTGSMWQVAHAQKVHLCAAASAPNRRRLLAANTVT